MPMGGADRTMAHAVEPVMQDRMNSALARQELRLVRWMLIVGGAVVAAVKLLP